MYNVMTEALRVLHFSAFIDNSKWGDDRTKVDNNKTGYIVD